MKKISLILAMTLLLTGCDSDNYDYTCTKTDTSDVYKKTETLKLGFDSNKVYKLASEIVEEHTTDDSINNAYANYQNLYDNYKENNVVAEYKKNEKRLNATYYLDKSDIDNMKIELPYDFTVTKDKFLKSLEDSGYECKEER